MLFVLWNCLWTPLLPFCAWRTEFASEIFSKKFHTRISTFYWELCSAFFSTLISVAFSAAIIWSSNIVGDGGKKARAIDWRPTQVTAIKTTEAGDWIQLMVFLLLTFTCVRGSPRLSVLGNLHQTGIRTLISILWNER